MKCVTSHCHQGARDGFGNCPPIQSDANVFGRGAREAMTCTVEMKTNRAYAIEEKRFYVPAIIRDICPRCGAPFERDLDERYLSYPPCGVPFTLQLACSAEADGKYCDYEWAARLQLNLSVELITLPMPTGPEGT